jgi:hypothetical protein
MTDVTTDEMFDRILTSLRENNAELSRELRAERYERVRQVATMFAIFIAGMVAGALLIMAI